MSYVRWFLWTLWYLPQPKPREFQAIMRRMIRLHRPWWKFRPYVWHSDDGNQWEVCFSGDNDYCIGHEMLKVRVSVSRDTGQVVSLRIYDEELKKLSRPPRHQTGEGPG